MSAIVIACPIGDVSHVVDKVVMDIEEIIAGYIGYIVWFKA